MQTTGQKIKNHFDEFIFGARNFHPRRAYATKNPLTLIMHRTIELTDYPTRVRVRGSILPIILIVRCTIKCNPEKPAPEKWSRFSLRRGFRPGACVMGISGRYQSYFHWWQTVLLVYCIWAIATTLCRGAAARRTASFHGSSAYKTELCQLADAVMHAKSVRMWVEATLSDALAPPIVTTSGRIW